MLGIHHAGGQGRDRTVDLTIFSRALVPTELPGLRRESTVTPHCAEIGCASQILPDPAPSERR